MSLDKRPRRSSSRSGRAAAKVRSVGNSFVPRPSTRYAASVHGAPQKPSSAVDVGSSARPSLSAGRTSRATVSGSGSRSCAMPAASLMGCATTGPGSKSKSMPRAGNGLMMSANTIAASSGNRRIGINVTSAASSAFVASALKLCTLRNSRYSGRYRPACRMIHNGRRGVRSRRSVCNKSLVIVLRRSFRRRAREAIADAAHGMKVQRGFGVALETLAQANDEVIDRARRREHLVSPDAVEDVLARDDAALPLGEHLENHSLLVREAVLGAIPRTRMISLEIDVVALQAQRRLVLTVPPASAQDGRHAQQQLLQMKGLGQIVVAAGLEAADP